MENYFKYLPVSQEDENWGLTILNAGCTHVEPNQNYPLKSHPNHHSFNGDGWRMLQEYQIIYITSGQGIFESESCEKVVIKAGTIIILFPNERHKYRPDKTTGWDEYWVGLEGSIIDGLFESGYLNLNNPCIYIGFNEKIFELFNRIIESTKTEKAGYQPLISGAVFYMLGICHSITRQNNVGTKEDVQIIDKSRILFRSNISKPYSPEQAAQELNVGYSWFRKLFKNYTGLSPGQYYLQLKIEHAKELLGNSNISIKTISAELSFQSSLYFSKIFKEKTGLTPTEYRSRSFLTTEETD